MKSIRNASDLIALVGIISLNSVAYCQSAPIMPANSSDQGKPLSAEVGVYPYAHFELGPGKGHADGSMYSFDATYSFKNSKLLKSVSVGSWYWMADAGNSLYEVHTTAMITNEVGIKGGYLTTSDQHGTAWDAFALYNLSSKKFTRSTKHPWLIQFGAGVYVNPSLGGDSAGFTGTISGSLAIGRKLDLVATYWYVNDQATPNHRILLGISKGI